MLEYRSPKGDNDMNNINDKYTLVHFCGIIIKIELNLVNPCL